MSNIGQKLYKMKNRLINDEEKTKKKCVFTHMPQIAQMICNNYHNPPEKVSKKKLYKSAFQILIERSRINNVKTETKDELKENLKEKHVNLTRKKVNDILLIINALAKKDKTEEKKDGKLKKRDSVNPFLTNIGVTNQSLSPLAKETRGPFLNFSNSNELLDNTAKNLKTEKDENKSLNIVKTKMKNKFGSDFYNKIKVHLLFSNKKSDQDLEKFKKFLNPTPKQTQNSITIHKEKPPPTDFLINEEEILKKTQETQEENSITLKEFQKKLTINHEDEFFEDYKTFHLKKAQKLVDNSHSYKSILASDLLRFPFFLKKLETESNNGSFFDDYCPLDSKEFLKFEQKQKLKLKLPEIQQRSKKMTLFLGSSPKSMKNRHFSISIAEKAALSDRMMDFDGKISEIQKDTKNLNKNNRVLKRKVKKEVKSLNFKFGTMIKKLNNLKL